MENIVVINCIGATDYAFQPIQGGRSSFSFVVDYAGTLPEVTKVVVVTDRELPGSDRYVIIKRDEWTLQRLFECMYDQGNGFDALMYVFGDSPLLDTELSVKMLDNHHRYFAEYTFADGYPFGLTPEIIKPSILPALKKLSEKQKQEIKRDSLFTTIQQDINAFDIETEISPQDLRLLRIHLCCDTKRNWMLTKRVYDEGGRDIDSVVAIIREKPELLRTLPAFFNIQISEQCPQSCFLCPYPKFGGNILEKRGRMSVQDFKRVCDAINRFADDAVLSISTWGEPALHERIVDIIEVVASYQNFSLIIETAGVSWEENTLKAISDIQPLCIDWIVSLDAYDPALYATLRGNGLQQALSTVETLFSLFPDHVYVQAVRTTLNEENLETFYRKWKEKTDNIIIQKYDYFSGYLPQRKVTDLSPLKRLPCWHLKRDMVVLIDGTVPLCREDIGKTYVLGNLFDEPIEEIWRKGEGFYREHLEKQYRSICEQCDEYYTFNF